MPYDYKIALEALSETDKNRLVCLYLSCDTTTINGIIDWQRATEAFGCASIESMKVMTRGALKKIENKGGKDGVEASPEKAKAAGGRKRKTKTDGEGDQETPETKKSRVGGRKKKEMSMAAEGDDEEATNGAIKAEADDDAYE